MTLNEYQKKATITILPTATNLPYLSLGLAGEAGEVANKVKKWIRDDNAKMTIANKKAIAEELGDALWYLAMLADHLGLNLEDVARDNVEKLASRKKRNVLKGKGDSR